MATDKYMVELVWRKQGEERTEWTKRETTEKKALGDVHDPNEGIAAGGEHPPKRGGVAGEAVWEHPPNKRETACAKMNERYLVGQATQNPFMPTNNYVQDIENQMNFLTPQKSS